jgi:uncharacterized cupin superfamily protein
MTLAFELTACSDCVAMDSYARGIRTAMRYSFRTMLVHIDDVPTAEREFGHIHGLRQMLGVATGCHEIGASRWRIPAGAVPSPMHAHGDEEEILFVLSGSGHALYGRRSFAIQAGDAMVFGAGDRPHTVMGGADGLEVLAFGSGSPSRLTWLPRSNTMWAGPRWLPLDVEHPFQAEQALGPIALPEPSGERPHWLVALADLEARPRRRGATDLTRADLGRAAGSRLSGLAHVVIAAGAEGSPPHCHSAEEELFYVLDGDGEVLLGDEPLAVRAGSVIARPPGTGVAHSFRAGERGLTLLAYGQRKPQDACFYPRSNKVALRGLGVRFRVEPLDYWDGEE